MPQFSAHGIQLEVETFGDPSHPALLLIMGLGMQLTAWPDDFCQALASAGYHVIRFDNRDIGLSSKIRARMRVNLPMAAVRYALGLPIPSPYRIDDMAADALGVLDALGIRAAHIVGASMGGMIAQNLVATHPDRCLSLTSIMSSSGDRRMPRASLKVTRLLIARAPGKGSFERRVEHYVRLFRALGGPGFQATDAQLRERLTRSLRRSYYPDGTVRQLLAIVASGDRSDLLRKINRPTLVLHGSADPLIPVAHGVDCARKIPAATLKLIPGMGHDLPPTLLPLLSDAILAHVRAVDSNPVGG